MCLSLSLFSEDVTFPFVCMVVEEWPHLSCLPLQIGHFSQQAVAITRFGVQIIAHSAKQVGCLLQLFMGLIQQTCSKKPTTILHKKWNDNTFERDLIKSKCWAKLLRLFLDLPFWMEFCAARYAFEASTMGMWTCFTTGKMLRMSSGPMGALFWLSKK